MTQNHHTASVKVYTDGGTGAAGGGGVGGMPAQAWHECVAVACGFHACVVGQSLYAPQLRGWFGSFSARQFAVLALDEFALQPQAVLRRVASFLGVSPFPRMVLEWNWQWNQLTQPPGKQLAAAAAATAAAAAAAAARAPLLHPCWPSCAPSTRRTTPRWRRCCASAGRRTPRAK